MPKTKKPARKHTIPPASFHSGHYVVYCGETIICQAMNDKLATVVAEALTEYADKHGLAPGWFAALRKG